MVVVVEVVVAEVVAEVSVVLGGGSVIAVVVGGAVVEVGSVPPAVDDAMGVVKVEPSSPQAATRIPRANNSDARRFMPDLLTWAAGLAVGAGAGGMAARGRRGPARSPPGVGDFRQKAAWVSVWGL